MSSTLNRAHVVVYAALAATVAILILGFYGHAHAGMVTGPSGYRGPVNGWTLEGSKYSPRVCFPKKDWGPAPDRIRPCVRITGVEEDGSFSYSVSDGDGTVRYTAGVGALDR